MVMSRGAAVSFAKEPYKRDYSAKEIYKFKEPTNRSHAISDVARCSRLAAQYVHMCVHIYMYSYTSYNLYICRSKWQHRVAQQTCSLVCVFVCVCVCVCVCACACIYIHTHVVQRNRVAALVCCLDVLLIR